MVKFYQAENAIEAQILKDYLAARRIDTVILGADLQGAAGELSALNFPTLWLLDERDLPLARRWLAEFQARQTEPASPWVCVGCGERLDGGFDFCWQCGAVRSDAGSADGD